MCRSICVGGRMLHPACVLTQQGTLNTLWEMSPIVQSLLFGEVSKHLCRYPFLRCIHGEEFIAFSESLSFQWERASFFLAQTEVTWSHGHPKVCLQMTEEEFWSAFWALLAQEMSPWTLSVRCMCIIWVSILFNTDHKTPGYPRNEARCPCGGALQAKIWWPTKVSLHVLFCLANQYYV